MKCRKYERTPELNANISNPLIKAAFDEQLPEVPTKPPGKMSQRKHITALTVNQVNQAYNTGPGTTSTAPRIFAELWV